MKFKRLVVLWFFENIKKVEEYKDGDLFKDEFGVYVYFDSSKTRIYVNNYATMRVEF